jgi:hypothetical protein
MKCQLFIVYSISPRPNIRPCPLNSYAAVVKNTTYMRGGNIKMAESVAGFRSGERIAKYITKMRICTTGI